jgi:HD-GYP domain-containing protein (c-di-GMP phosphodiesterase class II)
MTSERPYHKPMTHEEAIQELVDNAGTQFDPDLVQLVIKERIFEVD